jgi:hypothetical protein
LSGRIFHSQCNVVHAPYYKVVRSS